MNSARAHIRTILARDGGVISVRDHPSLRSTLYRLVETGELVVQLPGVMVPRKLSADPDVRIRAAARWCPHGVITGRAAARLTFWRDLPVPVVDVAGSARRSSLSGIRYVQAPVPPEWIWRRQQIAMTSPPRTILDLLPDLGGAAISEGLRMGVRMDDLWSALEAATGRRGNRLRRQMLHRYRDRPWSEAEQELHVILRRAHIAGWISNYPCRIAGHRRFLDVVFEELGVVIEVDGYEMHGSENRAQFERDRFTADWLSARGWVVLRFTWLQITQRPDWVVDTVRRVLARDWGHNFAPRLPR